jgi:hypothetical protein
MTVALANAIGKKISNKQTPLLKGWKGKKFTIRASNRKQ